MHFLFLLQMTRRAILCSTIYLAFYCVFHRRVTCFSFKFEHHKFIIYDKLVMFKFIVNSIISIKMMLKHPAQKRNISLHTSGVELVHVYILTLNSKKK